MPRVPVTRQTPKPPQPTRPRPITNGVPSGLWPDKDEGIKMTVYGRSGTGKTTLWSTFPDPILAVIVSGSARPGELRSIDTPENRKRIFPKVLSDTSEFQSFMDEAADYATVVLDHASGLQDLRLKEILGLDRIPEQKSWGLASREQYGQCTLSCKEMMRQMFDLPCNVVVVAQERNFDEGGSSDSMLLPSVGASLTPSLAGWLNQASDYIVQTFIREETIMKASGPKGSAMKKVRTGRLQYCLRTAPDEVYITKFRAPKGTELPSEIIDPDYEKLYNIVRGAHRSG